MPPLRRYRNGPRPTRGRTLCTPTASSELVLLARQSQAQVWSRTRPKFLQTQGPVARREFRLPLRFCAPEGFCLVQGVTPVIGVRGKATMSTKCSSGAVPGGVLVTLPPRAKSLAARRRRNPPDRKKQSPTLYIIRKPPPVARRRTPKAAIFDKTPLA